MVFDSVVLKGRVGGGGGSKGGSSRSPLLDPHWWVPVLINDLPHLECLEGLLNRALHGMNNLSIRKGDVHRINPSCSELKIKLKISRDVIPANSI